MLIVVEFQVVSIWRNSGKWYVCICSRLHHLVEKKKKKERGRTYLNASPDIQTALRPQFRADVVHKCGFLISAGRVSSLREWREKNKRWSTCLYSQWRWRWEVSMGG